MSEDSLLRKHFFRVFWLVAGLLFLASAMSSFLRIRAGSANLALGADTLGPGPGWILVICGLGLLVASLGPSRTSTALPALWTAAAAVATAVAILGAIQAAPTVHGIRILVTTPGQWRTVARATELHVALGAGAWCALAGLATAPLGLLLAARRSRYQQPP